MERAPAGRAVSLGGACPMAVPERSKEAAMRNAKPIFALIKLLILTLAAGAAIPSDKI